MDDEEEEIVDQKKSVDISSGMRSSSSAPSIPATKTNVVVQEEPEEEGELTVDVYQSPAEIIIQSMVAGVQPENLAISITRDLVTIKGKREKVRGISDEDYFLKELYWGSFSRKISLPQEIEPEGAEAIEKHGLLIIKLPKIDKNKQTLLKVKSF